MGSAPDLMQEGGLAEGIAIDPINTAAVTSSDSVQVDACMQTVVLDAEVPTTNSPAVMFPPSPALLSHLHCDLSCRREQLLEALRLLGQLHEPASTDVRRMRTSHDSSITCYHIRSTSYHAF